MLTEHEVLEPARTPAGSAEALPAGEASFAGWLERLRPHLHRYMRRRLGTPDRADDAVQETLLRMLRYHTIRDAGQIRALLFRVAASVVADHGRQARSTHASEQWLLADRQMDSGEPPPDRILAGREQLSLIKEAIRSLPPRCRQVFLLHRFEGLTYQGIALRLGTSARTVENQVAHALAACRRAIGEERRRAFKSS